MNLRHVVSLLPTPRASANENRQTKRTPSQEAGMHGLCLAAEVCELLPVHQRGAGTVRRSKGGKRSSAALPPGQLTIWDG